MVYFLIKIGLRAKEEKRCVTYFCFQFVSYSLHCISEIAWKLKWSGVKDNVAYTAEQVDMETSFASCSKSKVLAGIE